MTFEPQNVDEFLAEHRPFFDYLIGWYRSLGSVRLGNFTENGRSPRRLAILSEDLVKGFTTTGRLSSPRIAGVVPEIARLFRAAYAAGVRDFVLPHDSHPPDSPEFEDYGPHCVTGTVEAETVDELDELPFSGEFTIMPKTSLNPAFGTDLDRWFDERPQLKSVIVVGDCTDLCVYQAAMHLRIRSVYMKRDLQVVVPVDCVETYHLGVEEAEKTEATPHDGDVLHLLFLYHMALNGVKVVAHIE